VYVKEANRGQGIASLLVDEVINQAKRDGVIKLYLQTEMLNGGLYVSHGFKIIEQVHYNGRDVAVMVAELVN
jgi:GNAT superfamily N-acetyltransferase